MATLAIGLGLKVAGVVMEQLAAHTARLHDAVDENQAADQAVPSYDADLLAVQQAYNNGNASVADCIGALQKIDTQIFNFLYSLHGKPGTAWNAPTTAEIGSGLNPSYSAACNKACTVACCIYLNDLRPGIFGRSNAGAQLNRGVMECILNGGGVATIPAVVAPPSQYGNYSRPAYTLTFKAPYNLPASPTQEAPVIATSLSGQEVPPEQTTAPGAGELGAATANATATKPGLLATLTNSEIVAILGVVGGIILVVTALFGQNALRVDR